MTHDPATKSPIADHRTAAIATWISVVRAYNECTTTLAQCLAPLGISVLQHEILMNLLETPGLTQQVLSKRCFSAKSGISMLVTGFVKEGIVQRSRSPIDSRAWNLSLTDKGLSMAKDVQRIQSVVVSRMASTYSMDDLRFLRKKMDESVDQLRDFRSSTTDSVGS